MLKLHPAIIHFPVALLSLAGLLAIISVLSKSKKEEWKDAAVKTLIAGTAFAALAVISGLIEEDTLKHSEAIHKILILHKYNGMAILFFSSGIVIWYWLRRKLMATKEYTGWAISVFAGSILVLAQGYLGGEMVYNLGAGVKPMETMMKGNEHEHGHSEKMKEEPGMNMNEHGEENNKEHKDVEGVMKMKQNKTSDSSTTKDTVSGKKHLKDMKY